MKNEALLDIAREIRNYAEFLDCVGDYEPAPNTEPLRDIADRLEAAAKRERTAHINDIHDALYAATRLPGNAAAIRSALVRCATLGEYCFQDIHAEVAKVARAALSAPARNCDVGTAEEQYRRFMTMCNSKDAKQCSTCMFRQNCYTSRDKCFARWAQMPYEEGGAK